MKIEGPLRIPGQVTRATKAGQPRTGETFASQLAEEPAAAAAAAGAPTLASVQAIVALQEVPDASQERKHTLARGHDLLDELEALKMALLSGRLPAARLGAIAALVRHKRDACDDPVLDALLADIELRAAVELAKLRRDV
ncbi:MAG: flagellar assembly protein FliX [Alphaproteobacteria bacterium]